MFLLSGTRTSEKKLGYIADFCPTCQSIRTFQLNRMGVGDHVYFVSLGCSQVLGHSGVCQDCKISMSVNALCYSGLSKVPGHDPESLITATFPNVREIHAGRLALARLLFEGKLKSAERDVMLADLWQSFAVYAEEKAGKGIVLGGRAGWGIVFTVGAVLLLSLSTILLPPASHETLFFAAGLALVAGVVYSIVQIALNPGRVSREIQAALALRLKPFDVSREEIVDYMGRLKRAGYKLGNKIKPDFLMSEIASARVPSLPHI